MSTSPRPSATAGRSGLSTIFLWVALLLLWVGERASEGTTRWVVSGAGAAALLLAAGMLLRRISRAQGQHRAALLDLTVDYALCAAALAAYAVQVDELGLMPEGTGRNVVRIAAAVLLVAGLLPATTVELSLRAVGDAPVIETWRVAAAGRGARIILLAVIAFAGVNFAAAKWNRKIDLSYFKTSKVGESNQKLAETLTQPVDVVLFFPAGNDVLEHVRRYVDELATFSDQVKVRIADQALDPELARKLKVRANGNIALSAGPLSETIRVGLDLENATSTLRKLDEEMHQRLLKVLRPPRIAYFTTGHLERDYAPPADDKRRGLSDLKDVLGSLGFTVKRLGLGEGLGSEVPKDATVVIVAGPLEPFLAAEVTTLHTYLDHGGRVLFLMDPDLGITGDELLAPLGLSVSRELVAADDLRYLWRLEGEHESPYNITTNASSSHPSMTTMTKAAGRLATIVQGSGTVRKTANPPPGLNAAFTLRTMPKNFLDTNGNGRYDEGVEQRATLDLVAAVAKNVEVEKDAAAKKEAAARAEGHAPPADATPKPAAPRPEPMRAVVFADADLAGNMVIRNQGNLVLVMDAVNWLAGDEAISGTVETEADVRITHRKDDDRIWFYGSSILVPATVLAAGLMYTRRSRRGGRETTQREAQREG